ncbi:hypothetical protein KJ885_03500 [Patescibacteria group bacterium]|nr:hypothetical protein [Patescibacteria group bacterium]
MELTAKKQTYLGLFLVSLASLMQEILLLRIFSVTMWYHFAFMAVSIAMFGMTLGAVIVYIFPKIFTNDRVKHHLALSSLFFSISILVSFLVYLKIPFDPSKASIGLLPDFLNLTLIYVTVSIPFIFSGIAVCLILTKFNKQVSSLYAADLIGAAGGCILLVYILNIFTGPTVILVIAFIASLAAIFFSMDTQGAHSKIIRNFAIICALFFLFGAVLNTTSKTPWLELTWVKGSNEAEKIKVIYEKWNSFSRITVDGDKNLEVSPFGWGLSPVYPADKKIKQLWLLIDANAGTPLTSFSGDLNDVDFLKYDIINSAHYLRGNADVLAIGSGGGRDVLSALVFNQKSVVGVEINKNIIDVTNKVFGDFTGHLDKNPKVTFVNDEARSHISRSENKFDIIQASLIDTWAATSAGAFALTENSLYTIEAWKTFLNHLNPRGILTFSRWYFRDDPAEIYRLTSLAASSLKQLGVENPRDNIIILRRMGVENNPALPDGVGTILVAKDPFSEVDLKNIEDLAKKMQFEIVLSPKNTIDPNFAVIASGKNLDLSNFSLNIRPPTDDTPFFFNMLKIKDIFNKNLREQGRVSFNMKAVAVVGILLIITFVLSLVFIVSPLLIRTVSETKLSVAAPFIIYFSSIGLGFMMVEISQMQRLNIFLGHPVYSLSVLLFALLLSGGIGSYLTKKINKDNVINSAPKRITALILSLIIFGGLTPYITQIFQSSNSATRIIISAATLFILGIFMGMAFPIGMKIAGFKSPNLTPLLWGVNGAMSVFASVLAVAVSLAFSISAAFWLGVIFYVIALLSLFLLKEIRQKYWVT